MTAKRIGALLLAGLMTVTAFSSCNKDKGPVMSKRTNVFAGEELQIPEGINYIQDMYPAGENVYITYRTEYSVVYDQNGEEQLRKVGYYYASMNYEQGYVVEETAPVVEVMETEMTVTAKTVAKAAAKAVAETAVAVETPVEEITDADGDGVADTKPAEKEEVKRPTTADEIVFGEQYSEVLLPEGWTMGHTTVNNLAAIPLDGSEMIVTEVQNSDPDSYSSGMTITPDGIMYSIMQKWTYNEETQIGSTTYLLEKFNIKTGELENSTDLNAEMTKAGLEEGSYYLGNLTADSSGNLYINAENYIIQLDGDGKYVSKVELGEGWIQNFYGMGDKLMVLFYSQTSSKTVAKLMEKGQLTDVASETLINAMRNYYGLYGMAGDKLYYGLSSGIWTYDFATDTVEEVMNYINSDIDYNTVNNTQVLPDGRIIMSNTDWSQEEAHTTLTVLSEIPDEQLKEEIIITLGCTNNDYQLTKAVIAYNKQNTGIRVSVKSYEHYNNQENEWRGAVTQFNNDIVTGNVPDIVLISSDMPSGSYFKKGIFADLNQFIDDEEVGLDRSKYLANVFEACSMNGKQYSMILSFRLRTLMAKSQYVGTEPGWTFEEMMDTINKLPEGAKAFFDYGRDNVIDTMFSLGMNSFVDWETGKTKFDSPGFIEYIKYLSTCSEKGYWDAYYESMSGDNYVYDPDTEREMQETYDLRHYNGMALFEFAYMNNFTAILEQRNNFGSKDITAIGFPTDDEAGNGAVIIPNQELAISAKSPAKKEAWQVIRYFMDDPTQAEVTYRFSINLETLEKNLANASENWYYYEATDQDYSWYKESGYSDEYIEFMKSRNFPFDEEACNQVMDLVKGATEVQRSDSALVDIIKEELSVFFSGSRSAEETARIIASRANIYIAENS